MKVSYRQAASDDLVRQFRYYLVTLNLPDVAIRFRSAVRQTVQSLRQHPFVGPRFHSSKPQFQTLRTWAVAGFESIRIYYLVVVSLLELNVPTPEELKLRREFLQQARRLQSCQGPGAGPFPSSEEMQRQDRSR